MMGKLQNATFTVKYFAQRSTGARMHVASKGGGGVKRAWVKRARVTRARVKRARVKRASSRCARWAVLLAFALAGCGTTGGAGAEDRAPASRVDTLRVVSYNIRHGRGTDDAVDLERTAAVLRRLQPDLVGLQEVDVGVERSGGRDQPAVLGRLLGMAHAFGAFFEYQGGEYGMAILSRHPILDVRSVPLPPGNEPRVALAVEVETPSGARLSVVNVHFDWVSDDGFRHAQARELATWLDGLDRPFVLLGDFNDVPDSRTLALFRERADEAAKPQDDPLTFPSTDPRREIDYVFAGPPGMARFDSTTVVDEPVASDHRPLVTIVRYEGRPDR